MATTFLKDQTRATIAYALVFAFILDAVLASFSWYSGEASGALEKLALIAVSFYFLSKANGHKHPGPDAL